MNKSETSFRSHGTSRSSKSSAYLSQWDDIRMAPSTLLGKMMPSNMQRAREAVAQKQRSSSSSRKKKSEARLQLDNSLHNFESTTDLPVLGLSSTSYHTSATSAASSLGSILVDPPANERPQSAKALSSILLPTKSDKKKKKKSRHSKSPKPNKESKRISKDETSKRKEKKSVKQTGSVLDSSDHQSKTKKSKSRERTRKKGQKKQPKITRPHKRASV